MLNLLGLSNPLGSTGANYVVWGNVADWSTSYYVVWGNQIQSPSGQYVVWATPSSRIPATWSGATVSPAGQIQQPDRTGLDIGGGRRAGRGETFRRRGRRVRQRSGRLQRRHADAHSAARVGAVLGAHHRLRHADDQDSSIHSRFSLCEVFGLASVLLFGPEVGALTLALDGVRISAAWKMNRLQTVFNFANLGLSIWISGTLFFLVSASGPLYHQGPPPRASSCRWRYWPRRISA